MLVTAFGGRILSRVWCICQYFLSFMKLVSEITPEVWIFKMTLILKSDFKCGVNAFFI